MSPSRRRRLLLAGLSIIPLVGPRAALAQPTVVAAADWASSGIDWDAGSAARVFGLDRDLAASILQPATRWEALPDRYAPPDLVWASTYGIPGAQMIRRVIAEDTRDLVRAAAAEGHRLVVASGYRSQTYQVQVFAAQAARWGSEETANRYSARPGYSQHQLGTTIDFTDSFRQFRGSGAAAWLSEHGHAFGFVLPYTEASEEPTGYVPEPWHARWVGRALAARLQELNYQNRADLSADDALAVVRAAAGLGIAG